MSTVPEAESEGKTMHLLNLTHLGLEINFLDRKGWLCTMNLLFGPGPV